MPLFDYECGKCGNKKKNEFVHSINEKVLCEKCYEPEMIRIFSFNRPMIIYKGSGFYCTENNINKWSSKSKRWEHAHNQITTADAESINKNNRPMSEEFSGVEKCSIKPIEGDLVVPQCTVL